MMEAAPSAPVFHMALKCGPDDPRGHMGGREASPRVVPGQRMPEISAVHGGYGVLQARSWYRGPGWHEAATI